MNIILVNGQIATLDPSAPWATSVGIQDGAFVAVGSDADVMAGRQSTR